nr:hypothetical protein Q903MT_gene5093 [Picea sitchensis]
MDGRKEALLGLGGVGWNLLLCLLFTCRLHPDLSSVRSTATHPLPPLHYLQLHLGKGSLVRAWVGTFRTLPAG